MIDVKSSNHKLRSRARGIIRSICAPGFYSISGDRISPSAPAEEIDKGLDELLYGCGGSVKIAVVVGSLRCSPEQARKLLDAAGERLSKLLQSNDEAQPAPSPTSDWCLCVDGGGTKTTAVIRTSEGRMSQGDADSSNL